jgi:hypothetical protein
MLWVPGVTIGFADWPGLTEYFRLVLEAGADVVLLEPPYHFSRAPEGTGSGEAFLSTDFADHLAAFAQEISDLRRLSRLAALPGRAGLLGASAAPWGRRVVMRAATFEEAFDFLVVKQPLVDWNAVLARPEMEGARRRILAEGVTPEAMERAYRALDPREAKPRLSPARIALLYGRFDQIAPEAPGALAGRGLGHRGRGRLPAGPRADHVGRPCPTATSPRSCAAPGRAGPLPEASPVAPAREVSALRRLHPLRHLARCLARSSGFILETNLLSAFQVRRISSLLGQNPTARPARNAAPKAVVSISAAAPPARPTGPPGTASGGRWRTPPVHLEGRHGPARRPRSSPRRGR